MKVGSSSLTTAGGVLDVARLGALVNVLTGFVVVLVSGRAVLENLPGNWGLLATSLTVAALAAQGCATQMGCCLQAPRSAALAKTHAHFFVSFLLLFFPRPRVRLTVL